MINEISMPKGEEDSLRDHQTFAKQSLGNENTYERASAKPSPSSRPAQPDRAQTL
jgi:hypothetical protein